MDLDIEGNAVCISGGTKGMGRACAVAYARERARIVVTGRSQHDVDETVEELKDLGARDAFGVRCDVAHPDQIDALFVQITTRWNELNTLVNMAGPLERQPGNDFSELSDESWQYYFNVGLMSVVRCSRAALPLMRKAGWGRIINISSITSRLGQPAEAGYAVAKAGVNALSKNMARGLAKDNILVNCVSPGAFYTPLMTGVMDQVDPNNVKYIRGDLASTADCIADVFGARSVGAIGRVANSDEIVPHVLLLGSRTNTYLVGANIPVDGGTDFSDG